MSVRRKKPEELRSHRWYGVDDLRSFGHRSRIKQMGYASEDYAGKPIIGIVNTWSDINQCHAHLRVRAEEVKRGIWQAGGFPIELPAISLSEPVVKPTTMLYRNFLAMETEELLRSHPCDGAVLMGGCDKTTPGLIMGALSMNLPAIFVPAGPMLRGMWRGQPLGSGSDTWKYWAELRAGKITRQDWDEIENGISRSFGTCMTMGTAATMMSIAETLGFALPGASSIPAPDSNHPRMATASGRRIVEMVWEDLKPSDFVTRASFNNAIAVDMAVGGSTNAVVHILAMAKRAGIDAHAGRPRRDRQEGAGDRQCAAFRLVPDGRLLLRRRHPPLLAQLGSHIDGSARTVNGKTIGENIAGAQVYNDDVIRSLNNPVSNVGALAVLHGNLAPDGAVIKPSAADPKPA
jgi:dihydroxyacid dehydratase/phosphogluconate dehydratase